jgi:hypothetical protein
MTPINITVPESLTNQKTELETILAGIASEEEKLAVQRKDIQIALNTITTGIAILSGQPLSAIKEATGAMRKPMSAESRQRIAEGLRKSAQAKAMAKAAQVVVSAPQALAPASVDAAVPDSPTAAEKRSKKGART